VNLLADYPRFLRGTVTQPGQSLHGYQMIKFDDDDFSIFVEEDVLMPTDHGDPGPPQPPPDAEIWRLWTQGRDVVVNLDDELFFDFRVGKLDVLNVQHGVWTVKFVVTDDNVESVFRTVLIHQNRLRLYIDP
jgi:hypothetical protein